MKWVLFVAVLVTACVGPLGCQKEQATACPQDPSENEPVTARNVGGDSQVSPEEAASAGEKPAQVAHEEPPLLLEEEASAEVQPLLLADEEPLLLLDEGPGADTPEEPMADNSRCHVCHMNYLQEEIAVVHARADMGCAGCHGECDAHIDDESWASGGNGTAPDIMFTRDKVNAFCMACHEIEGPDHETVLEEPAGEECCTGCHGGHRLAVRKCKWK